MSQVQEKNHTEFIKDLARAHKIEPLKAGQSVTYVPIAFREDPKTKITYYPPSTQVNGRVTVLHPHTGLPEPLVYVKSQRPVKKNGFTELEEESPLIFIESNGLTVGPKDQLLYFHMEMNDENASKPGRDTSVRAKYMRLDKAKTATEKIDKIYDEVYVSQMILDMDIDNLKVFALKYKIDSSREVDEIKHDLLVVAKKDPQAFIRQSPNQVDVLAMLVRDAKKFKFILYDGMTRKWSLNIGEEEKEVVEVAPGGKADEEMVAFLMDKTGKETLTALKKRMKGGV